MIIERQCKGKQLAQNEVSFSRCSLRYVRYISDRFVGVPRSFRAWYAV